MPNIRVFQKSYFHQLSPDNQTASLAPLDLAFAALPPKERARVIDLGRTRYGAPALAAPQVNVERLNDSLSRRDITLPQNLACGARRGLAIITQTGANLTGLINEPFNPDLGNKVQSKRQQVATDIAPTSAEASQNNADLVERGVGELPFVILRCCAAGKLVGAGVRHAPCRPGPRNQSHHGPTAASEAAGNGVFLGTDLEVIGGRPVLISQ